MRSGVGGADGVSPTRAGGRGSGRPRRRGAASTAPITGTWSAPAGARVESRGSARTAGAHGDRMTGDAPPASDPAAIPRKPLRRRRWVKVLLLLGLLSPFLAGAAPWILTLLAPSLLDHAEGRFVSTDVRADQIRLGWLSGATLRGLAIPEPATFPPGDALSV